MIKFSVGYMLALVLCVSAAPVAAQTETLKVTPNMSYGWTSSDQTTGTSEFVNGPATPPVGTGSLKMTTGPGDPTKSPAGGKTFFFNNSYAGLNLTQLSYLQYSTYSATSSTLTPAINIAVDFVGNGASFTTLVFEPVYYTFGGPTVQPVLQGQWQTWNAMYGKWWSTRNIPGACAFTCYVTLQEIKAANPNAKILPGGIQFVAGQNSMGAPWANYAGFIDDIWIGLGSTDTADQVLTRYNLELHSYPQTAEECMKGGYKTFNPGFKNQGQCIASVVSSSPQ